VSICDICGFFPLRVRVALAVSVGVHVLVFGGLAFWVVPKTLVSCHSPPVIRIDTTEEAIPKPALEPRQKLDSQPVAVPVPQSIEKVAPIPPPVAAKKPTETKPVTETVVVQVASQMEITNKDVSTVTGGDRAAALPGGTAAPPYQPGTKIPPPAILQQARYRRNPPPVYPAVARRLGQEGGVLLVVQVNDTGHPTEIKIKASSGFPLLDTAAQKAVSRWEFIPARSIKGAVASEVEVPVQFKLDAR